MPFYIIISHPTVIWNSNVGLNCHHQGPVSLSYKTSYCKISLSLEVTRGVGGGGGGAAGSQGSLFEPNFHSQGSHFGWDSVAKGTLSVNFDHFDLILAFFRSNDKIWPKFYQFHAKLLQKWLILWYFLLPRVWFWPIFHSQGYDFGPRSP